MGRDSLHGESAGGPSILERIENASAKLLGNNSTVQHAFEDFLEGDELPECKVFSCGEQRLALRSKFNTVEISISKIFSKYDKNNDQTLEIPELRVLLKDYSSGGWGWFRKDVNDEDLHFILQVADKDADDSVSASELLEAMRAWYAFNNMPRSVGAAMTRYKIGDGPMPSDDALKEFLITLNENMPVHDREVHHLRRQILVVGGVAERVTVLQVQRAVATWYLHIERGETDSADLAKHAALDLQAEVANNEIAQSIQSGTINMQSKMVVGALCFSVFILIGCPILDILIGSKLPSNYQCEHPHLSGQLVWAGWLSLLAIVALIVLGAVVAFAEQMPPVQQLRIPVAAVTAILWVAVLSVFIFGFNNALSSTPQRCGFVLWHWTHFTFVLIPAVACLGFCCVLPGCGCASAVRMYIENEKVDQQLKQDNP